MKLGSRYYCKNELNESCMHQIPDPGYEFPAHMEGADVDIQTIQPPKQFCGGRCGGEEARVHVRG